MAEWMVTVGDCREVMAAMDAESVDSIVCDPPYGLEFMGKDWDRPWAVTAKSGVGYAGRDDLTLPSHRDNRNANCRACGGRMRGEKRCVCVEPKWDRHPREDMLAYQVWFETVAVEALRVLKPGGHLLAFGGTRTFHRMTVAIEDAGFEVRDCLSWLYGSGFPKSLNVGKAIDKAAGAEREVLGEGAAACEWTRRGEPCPGHGDAGKRQSGATVHSAATAPATDEAARWEGWGTALKPAWEPIVMARKRLVGTVAGNVLAYGTGGLNIDGSRIGVTDDGYARNCSGDRGHSGTRNADEEGVTDLHAGGGRAASGRWPANVLLDEGAAAALDEQTGETSYNPSAVWKRDRETAEGRRNKTSYAPTPFESGEVRSGYGDRGGASRFFYVSKASRRDRNEGLDGMEEKEWTGNYGDGIQDNRPHTKEGYTYSAVTKNHHPTVKPTALMRHLVRLVTPPGGLVLDPFTGSGSTGKAAILEGFRFHGIEQDAEYAEIARARIAWAEQQADEEPDQPTLM